MIMQATVATPRYARADQSLIEVALTINGEVMPFTASPLDSEEHGRDIFASAIAGEYGPVAAFVPVAPVARQVKIEAQRRIIGLVGTTDLQSCIIKQLNMLMRATEVSNKRSMGVLTDAEITEANALQAIADAIKVIRAKSNAIETLTPIPADYAADARWS